MLAAIGVIALVAVCIAAGVWVVLRLEKPAKPDAPNELMNCPFCKVAPTPLVYLAMYKFACTNPTCEIQPRTWWSVSVDAAMEDWQQQRWANKPLDKPIVVKRK